MTGQIRIQRNSLAACAILGTVSTSCRSNNPPQGSLVARTQTLYAEGNQQDTTTEQSGNKQTTVSTIKLWAILPDRFRIERHYVDYVTVDVANGRDAWIFGSAERKAYHSTDVAGSFFRMLGEMRKDFTGGPQHLTGIGAKMVGQQRRDGTECDVYHRKTKDGILRAYFPHDGNPIPVRLEMDGRPGLFGAKTSFRSVINLKKRMPGPQMNDAWFRPPPDYHVQPVGNGLRSP